MKSWIITNNLKLFVCTVFSYISSALLRFHKNNTVKHFSFLSCSAVSIFLVEVSDTDGEVVSSFCKPKKFRYIQSCTLPVVLVKIFAVFRLLFYLLFFPSLLVGLFHVFYFVVGAYVEQKYTVWQNCGTVLKRLFISEIE